MNRLGLLACLALAVTAGKPDPTELLEDEYTSVQDALVDNCWVPSWDVDAVLTWDTDATATVVVEAGDGYAFGLSITFTAVDACNWNTQSNWEVSWEAADTVNESDQYEAYSLAGVTETDGTCTITSADDGDAAYASGTAMMTSMDIEDGDADSDCGYSVYLLAADSVADAAFTVDAAPVTFDGLFGSAVATTAGAFLLASALLF